MSTSSSRRRFLQGAAATSGLGFLTSLPVVRAQDTKLAPEKVKFDAGIEPMVQLLETTSRKKLLEAVAGKIRGGAKYNEVLAALLLAGVRNVQPRPSVGFKFHAVLVVNSAHLASLASPPRDRWLPLFWALDYYKAKQLEEERASGWKLPPPPASVPAGPKARKAFINAMNNWDAPAADAAIAGLARTAPPQEIYELLYTFGARDFRSIGHKAIYVANSERTLKHLGWQHAEPVLRSLVYAMLNHTGEPNPAKSDLAADRSWRQNKALAARLKPGWQKGKPDAKGSSELLETLHTGDADEAMSLAMEQLQAGHGAQTVWDAALLGAGEVLMRQPGIIGLHALTSANALRYAYGATRDDNTRRRLLLQACAFVTHFRAAAKRRGRLENTAITKLASAQLEADKPAGQIEEMLAAISRNRTLAAGKILGYLEAGGDLKPLIDGARQLVYMKGDDAHDYKFAGAVLEDYQHISPTWRNRFIAASAFNLSGSGHRDSQLIKRTRAALG